MDFFSENPWKFVIGGALVEIGLVIALVKSGRGFWLAWIGGVAIVAAGLILVERLIVTEREQVEITLYDAAEAVEKNDINAVMKFIAPAAPRREELRARLPRYHIEKVSIKNDLKITVNDKTSPPSATAEFHVVVTGGDRGGNAHDVSLPFYFVVFFERDKDRWLINGYDERSILQGLK